jgi:hypothetical protein
MSKTTAKYSGKDARGTIYVDCAECDKGGNGNDKNKCSSGGKIKKGDKNMCFSGTLIDGLVISSE